MNFPHYSLFKQALHQCQNLHSLSKIHTYLIINGFIKHPHLSLQTIQLYLSFHLPNLAISIYHSTHSPTSPLQLRNLVIRALSDHEYFSHLLSLYSHSQHSGSRASDNFTFPFVVKACAALSNPVAGKEVHCAVLRTGHGGNLVVMTALVGMYAKMGLMGSARKVFDEMPERDLVSWNALISGYASNGLNREAFLAFWAMQVDGNLRPNASTFVSVVGLKGASIGKPIHAFALKLGVINNESVVSSLINMYAGLHHLGTARELFDLIKAKDLVSWNTMISAYAQNGRKPGEALEIFRLMGIEGVRPNLVTMVSVLQSCGDLSSIHLGQSLHAVTVKFGQVNLISVTTCLVSMYAELGELDAAQSLFHELPDKNLLLYNSMVSAYLLSGQSYAGLATFRDMQQLEGLIPDTISIISTISGCSMCKDLNLGRSVHAYSLRRGFSSNTNVMNALLFMYSDCDHSPDAQKLFQRMEARNVISWNTLISAQAKNGDTKASLDSFRRMQKEDIRFDLITIISILPSFYLSNYLYCGMAFHALAIINGFDSDVSLNNAIITMYGNCSTPESAQILFESLSYRRSIISWNALMTGLRNNSLFDEVMALFDRMKKEGHNPNSVTLLNLLPICETKLQGKSIHGYSLRNMFELESSLLTSVVSMYARFHDSTTCHLLFDLMDKQNVVSWNTMMSVYTHIKVFGRVVITFKEMLAMGVEPDTVTMLSLASACSQLGSLVLAQSVTGFVFRKGFDKSVTVINDLIDANARCGSLSFARDLFDRVDLKDSITWSTMINAYGMHGDGQAALRLYYSLQEAGVKPDDITFVSVLSACSHSGLVEQGRAVFESMVKVHGMKPNLKHFACLVDLLGRAGFLEEAYQVLRSLLASNKGCEGMVESLLGACRSHGDVEMGEVVGKLMMELSTSSASSRVMLSNIYAKAEKWEDSGRLRCDMELKGLKKDPGFSVVEVN